MESIPVSVPRHLMVGQWWVQPDLDRIEGPAGEVQLMPKAMAVLMYLAERPGQVVSTDELIDAVWLGRPMGDNPVYKCINQLRTVLGDDRKAPSYITTVHTKGYRLIAPVEWRNEGENPAETDTEKTAIQVTKDALPGSGLLRRQAWGAAILVAGLLVGVLLFNRTDSGGSGDELAETTQKGQPSIAVLPFANMSPGPGQDYFSDGLTEELIAQLATLPGLRVIGRTSSFAFKGKHEDVRMIGRTLGVNHILEGSIRKEEGRVRVTAQLINPADGSHLWAHTYDRSLDDIFTIQEEIALTVASALRVSISARIVSSGGTRNFEAYDAYLAGLSASAAGGSDNVLASIAAFERATIIDPEFKSAWGALANELQLALVDIPARRSEWLQKLAETENRLATLDPTWPTVIYLSAQREMFEGNLVEAEQLFDSLKELPPSLSAPNLPHGVFLLSVGRTRDAIKQFNRDQQAEPLALTPSLWLQIAFELAGDFTGAEMEYQRALGFATDTRAIRTMALIRAISRRDETAIRQELLSQIDIAPLTRSLNEAMLRHYEDPTAAVAELQRQLNDPMSLNNSVLVMMISAWAVYFGEPELAVKATEKLPALLGLTFNWIVWRPIQRDMRRLPEFKALVRAWGLEDYWRTTGNWGDYCRPLGLDDFECDLDPYGT
ncbi:MAG TPA: winged helix-turn-helix domain-containing protein [Xanthomonadales bacterium]|nr:winged helix-turn-helix domain-containing protein [Xanthomonadales bacterium]